MWGKTTALAKRGRLLVLSGEGWRVGSGQVVHQCSQGGGG